MSNNTLITNNNTNINTNNINLQELNINCKFKKDDIERARELEKDYKEILEELKSYPSERLSIDVNKELTAISNKTYYNFTHENTFIQYILIMKEWLSDCKPKLTFGCLQNMLNSLKFELNPRYLLSNLLFKPLDIIQIRHSPINFSIAYKICDTLNIPMNDTTFIDKWAISTVQDNNGSFYKKKEYKNGWFELLQQFCDEKKIQDKYKSLKKILNKILVPHWKDNEYFVDTKYLSYEQELGDKIINDYYDESIQIDDNSFNEFIYNYELKQGNNFKFETEQFNAIYNAIKEKCSIITGPPGTGKTTITKAIISYLKELYTQDYVISLLAPTGKAAKTLMDAVNKDYELVDKTICGTLHKQLFHTFKFIWKKKMGMDVVEKFKNLPDHIDCIIIDEFSMTDIFLFEKLLLWSRDFKCKLIFVGDNNQLPPVGKGRPFSQLIKSKLLTTTYLTKIKRQDQGTLKDCIINIQTKDLSIDDFNGLDTQIINHDFKKTKETTQIFRKIVEENGKDNLIIITPEHKGFAGTKELNRLLQTTVYNILEPDVHGSFKDKDYIMRTKNCYSENNIRVNGDSGIIEFDKPSFKTNFKPSKKATIYYDSGGEPESIDNSKLFEEFTLNYCNTVHKYQGSQKNIVVVCVSPEHFSLKFGNALKLVYTAISRAQKKLIIVGDSKIFFKSQYVTEHKFITSFMEQFTEIETPDWL